MPAEKKSEPAASDESINAQLHKMDAVGRLEGVTVQDLVKLMEANPQIADVLRSCRSGRYEAERSGSIAMS